jgi:hypothetical protein
MMRITQTVGAIVVILGIALLIPAAAQPANSFALFRFNDQIASYMTLRNEVQEHLGVPQASSNSTDLVAMQSALAQGIRKARPRAQAGDIFNADAGYEFRRRIQRALQTRGVSEGGLLADLRRDSPESLCAPTVNGNFDWRFGTMMPTAIIEALPDLPWPLQYRFACRDLVLLDVDAGLIVDVLPDALTVP